MIGRLSSFKTTVSFAAMLMAASAASAQSTLPPPDTSQTPANATANTTGAQEIVITGSRIRRNPLDLDAPRVFLDQQDIAKTGLNSINDVLQRLPSSGGGAN